MLRVGLTGGIGSGKSTVAALFEVLGIPVSYADREAKQVMNNDPALREAIIRHFGAAAYEGGTLNRAYLASAVFTSPDRLELLNSLVHPATISAGQEWVEQRAKKGYPYVIREAALIFESRSALYLDFVIGVRAPSALRIHRAMQRDNSTREEVLLRMNNQIDEDIKMKLCDAVIENDEQQAIIPQVLDLHEKLKVISVSPTPP